MDGDASLALQTILTGQQSMQADLSALRSDVSKALTHLEVIDTRNKNADDLHRDFEARLRALESAKARIFGAAAVLGTLAGGASGWLALVVGRGHG